MTRNVTRWVIGSIVVIVGGILILIATAGSDSPIRKIALLGLDLSGIPIQSTQTETHQKPSVTAQKPKTVGEPIQAATPALQPSTQPTQQTPAPGPTQQEQADKVAALHEAECNSLKTQTLATEQADLNYGMGFYNQYKGDTNPSDIRSADLGINDDNGLILKAYNTYNASNCPKLPYPTLTPVL